MPSDAAGSAEQGPAFSVSMRHAFVPFSGDFWVFRTAVCRSQSQISTVPKAAHPLAFYSLFVFLNESYADTGYEWAVWAGYENHIHH